MIPKERLTGQNRGGGGGGGGDDKIAFFSTPLPVAPPFLPKLIQLLS